MARFGIPGFPGQTGTAKRQTRNAVSALGQREDFSTYVGVWLTGIAIGVVLMLTIFGLALLNNDRVTPAAASASDRNSTGLIGNRPIADRPALAQEGYTVFTQKGCQGCHLQGGYASGGVGPRLLYSGNARDSTYIHSIVRWGYSPMPAYPPQVISEDELYKIVVYLQYAQDNRTTRPEWVK